MKYQFAIIGCGKIAERHAENIAKVGMLKAVCDVIPSRANALAKKYGATPYYTIDELLLSEKEIDIVSVCTPNGLHAEHSIKSLQSGKHVLCEKPMCISSVAAWHMIETAYHFNKKLFIVKQNRFNPGVQLLKQLLAENKLGAIYSFQINCFWNRPQEYYTGDWKGTATLDGGILYTQFSHFIDLLYWLLGDVKEVKAFKGNFKQRQHFDIEDTGVAIMEMQNGAIGTLNYTINTTNRNIEGSIAAFGEKGSVKIGGQYLNKMEWYDVNNEPTPELEQNNPSNQYGFYEGSMSNHHLVYEQLIQALNNENNSMVAATEAIKTVEIIEKIYKAATTVS